MLLLHGEPTWSDLYRHMIPPFVSAGYRRAAIFVQEDDPQGFVRSVQLIDEQISVI